MSESVKQFSFRLPEDSLYSIKKAALERRTSPAELVKQVLEDWWKTQPEGKTGPLFPLEEGDAPESPQVTPTKASPKKAAAKESNAPLAKSPKKGAKR